MSSRVAKTSKYTYSSTGGGNADVSIEYSADLSALTRLEVGFVSTNILIEKNYYWKFSEKKRKNYVILLWKKRKKIRRKNKLCEKYKKFQKNLKKKKIISECEKPITTKVFLENLT